MSEMTNVQPSRLAAVRHQLVGVAAGAATALALFGAVSIGQTDDRDKWASPSSIQPATISVPLLKGLLTTVEAIRTTMGSTEMQEVWSKDALLQNRWLSERPECIGTFSGARLSDYAGHGWVAAQSHVVADRPKRNSVYESVVSFPSAADAKAFVEQTETRWAACSRARVDFVRPDGTEGVWMVGSSGTTDGVVGALSTLEGANGWQAQHVLLARNNVVVDVVVAGYSVRNQAFDLAASIAATVSSV